MSAEETNFEQVEKSWCERQAENDQRFAEQLPVNKATLLRALAEAGITEVTVSYNGCGDEGRIDSIVAQANGEDIELPGIMVELTLAPFRGGEPVSGQQALPDAIAGFAEDLLHRHYPWWEDNDGAYGEVVFDVAAGVITLVHNARYTAANAFQHEF